MVKVLTSTTVPENTSRDDPSGCVNVVIIVVIILNKSAVAQRKVSVYRQFELATLPDIKDANHHWLYYLLQRQPVAPVTQQPVTQQLRVASSVKAHNIGSVYIKPAAYSVFWPWQGTDDSLILLIPPDFLSHLAINNRLLGTCQIELLPAVNPQDTALDRLFLLLSQEIETVQPGSRTYLDSLIHVLGLHLLRYYCKVENRQMIDNRSFGYE